MFTLLQLHVWIFAALAAHTDKQAYTLTVNLKIFILTSESRGSWAEKDLDYLAEPAAIMAHLWISTDTYYL